ncbi:hypothetical protein AAZX31_18G084500 [Glycine max]|uniref:Wax synthase domain-containing protein n=1 Tax=Glycine max TaxID=3847 RepID=A0A0R0EY43_SOYBN
MYGEIERFIKVWISAILGLCYCYYIAARIPKGFLRLLSLLPILYLFIILHLNISSPNLVGYTSFFLVQLGIFKLLLFSFNKGPLALSPPNIVHFISIASLPISPKPTNKNNTTNTQKPKWLLPLKLLIFAMIERVYEYNEYFHPHFILVLYCLHLWNLLSSCLLRSTLYNPVSYKITGLVGPTCATLAAMLAMFLVSGLVHELIYYHVTRVPPPWEVTSVKKVVLRRGWRLHRAMSGPLVVAFLAISANWLFFPQLLRNEMDRKSSE